MPTPNADRYRVVAVNSRIPALLALEGKVGTCVRIIPSFGDEQKDTLTLDFGGGKQEQFSRYELRREDGRTEDAP